MGCAIVAGENEAATLRDQAQRFQKIGGKNQILSAQELKALEPNVRIDDLSLAVYEPDAGYADPVQATQTLAARAKESGVIFKTGTLVKGIQMNVGRISGVQTTTGDVEALSVVLMIGAWTDRFLKTVGVQLGIQNTRAQVVFFDRPAELKQGHTAFIDWTTSAFMRPHTFGLTMAGLNQSNVEEKNPDSFDESVPPSFIADVQRRIAARLPIMEKARYIRGHAGMYDTTGNGRPIISRVPGIDGLFVATGFSNQGFAFAPAVGACVAEMVTEGEASTVDLSELKIRV
jgi:sarcosine oxidase subunit beta